MIDEHDMLVALADAIVVQLNFCRIYEQIMHILCIRKQNY